MRSSDDAIIAKDLNGIITDWNDAAERLFGYSPAEAVGRHISLIAPPGQEGEMREIIARIRVGETVEHFETRRRRKDGALVDISLTVSPIHDFDGRIIGASKIARDIGERRRAEERLKLMTREIDHRVKNVLGVAQAILRLTRADSLPEYIKAVEGRIMALARVHSRVAENRWDGADLRSLIDADIEVFSAAGARMTAEGQPLWVTPAAAQVIAIILHELSTNAAQHGALSSDAGAVTLMWRRDDSGDLHLSWSESGGPAVSMPERRGFGTQIIERSVPDQLGGHAAVSWLPEGLRCDFVVPAQHIVEPSRGSPSTT